MVLVFNCFPVQQFVGMIANNLKKKAPHVGWVGWS